MNNCTEVEKKFPTQKRISLDQPLDQIAMEIVRALPMGALFKSAGEFCRIVPTLRGEAGVLMEGISPTAFLTWISQYATFCKKGKVVSLTSGIAKAVMESYIFRDSIPVIEQVSLCQLPVGEKDANGKWRFTPTRQGYDERTQTYTLDSVPIDWEAPMSWEDAVTFLNHQFSECRFEDNREHFEKSTGMAIVVATMLGQFLRLNINRYPICIAEANRPGAGKGFLLEAMLAPFYGRVATSTFSSCKTRLRDEVIACFRSGKGYCFFDNVGKFKSEVIEQAVTSGCVCYRQLYTHNQDSVRNRMQFFVTGNNLDTREDTDRRARRIMLINDSLEHNKAYKNIISDGRIADPSWQKQMREALWGIVTGWVQAGCPDMGCNHLASFDDWRQLAGNITRWAGWSDPCASQEEKGDAREKAFLEVLRNMATTMSANGKPCETSIEQIVSTATQFNLWDDIQNGGTYQKALQHCQKYKNAYLKVRMADFKGREFWLQEDRVTELGGRPRRLRVYFREVDAAVDSRSHEEPGNRAA